MELEEIIELFEKLELFPTLDSINLILPYTNNQSITGAFNFVFREKYEKCTDEFEGLNEYDDICQILNFDLSEFKKNIDIFSPKELMLIQFIINNALNGIDKEKAIAKVIPVLEEYKEVGTNKFIEETEIENFFNKFDINELQTLNIILDNNHELSSEKYKNVFSRVLEEKENKSKVEDQDSSLFNILYKVDNLNKEEFDLLYELVENAIFYLSSVQDYSYAYKYVIDDFNIDEYPIIMVYKLEEKLSEKMRTKEEKNKQLVYRKNNNI